MSSKPKINKRRQRLEALLERLRNDEEVSLRDFKNAISAEEYQDYAASVEMQRDFSNSCGSGSSGYNEYFKKGMFHYNKGEGAKSAKLRRRYHDQAEDCFERALEELESDLARDPAIANDYDRSLRRSELTPDPIGMPRLRSSKSLGNKMLAAQRLGKRKLKIQALESALSDAKVEEAGNVLGKVVAQGAKKVLGNDRSKKSSSADVLFGNSKGAALEKLRSRLSRGHKGSGR
jgi:hypothetical protein